MDHLKTGPFDFRTQIDHLKSGLVWYWDVDCTTKITSKIELFFMWGSDLKYRILDYVV
jgi:hypothetical protein